MLGSSASDQISEIRRAIHGWSTYSTSLVHFKQCRGIIIKHLQSGLEWAWVAWSDLILNRIVQATYCTVLYGVPLPILGDEIDRLHARSEHILAEWKRHLWVSTAPWYPADTSSCTVQYRLCMYKQLLRIIRVDLDHAILTTWFYLGLYKYRIYRRIQ